MIDGVMADRTAALASEHARNEVASVFSEALQILSLSRDQLNLLGDR